MVSGPLIIDPAKENPIEYATLSLPAHICGSHARALEQFQAMQFSFFGAASRTLTHFHAMLELNQLTGPRNPIREQFGITRYFITYAKRQRTEKIIAGSAYLAIPWAEGAMICIPFTFVDPDERESGIGEQFRTVRSFQANAFLKEFGLTPSSGQPQLTSWCEFENSLLLTLDDHRTTIEQAKIAPLRRERHWYKVGYRSFDFDHMELASIDGGVPCPHYSLNILSGSPEPLIPSEQIARLVTVNAGICRLHGNDPNDDPMHREEIEQIMSQPTHRPRDRRAELAELEPRLTALLAKPNDPATAHLTVRQLLKLEGAV